MSYYQKYTFVPATPIFIKVKEELNSYFDTGIVDDTLFPMYVTHCLRKLGRSSYPVNQLVLNVKNYKATLPDDFYATREAWMCTHYASELQFPSATYTQIKSTSYKIDTQTQEDVYCRPCDACQYPDVIEAVYKTTNTAFYQWRRQYLLTPGSHYPSCPNDLYCANFKSVAANSYDVRDGKFVTSFEEGDVYLQYYSTGQNEDEDQLVPDTEEIFEYIEFYIKEKMFEQIWNRTTDETFNQSYQKYIFYKQKSDEALIIARTENKKEDIYRQQRAIKRTRNRNNKYRIR